MAMFSPLDEYDRKTLVDMAVEADLAACKRLRGIVGKQERLDGPGMRGHRRQFGAEEFCRLFNLKLSKPVTIPMALLDETGPNMENYIGAKPKARKKAVPFGYEQGLRDGGGLNPARPRFRGDGQAQVDDPIQWIPQEAIRAEDPAANPVEAQPRLGGPVILERDGMGRIQVPVRQVHEFLRLGWRLARDGEDRNVGLRDVPPAPAPEVPRIPPPPLVREYARVDIEQQRVWLNEYLENERHLAVERQRVQNVLDRQMQQVVDEDPF